jgi:hypothetical protein
MSGYGRSQISMAIRGMFSSTVVRITTGLAARNPIIRSTTASVPSQIAASRSRIMRSVVVFEAVDRRKKLCDRVATPLRIVGIGEFCAAKKGLADLLQFLSGERRNQKAIDLLESFGGTFVTHAGSLA